MVGQQKYSGGVSRRTGGVTAALDARRAVLRRDGRRSMQLRDAAASPGRTTRRPTAVALLASLAALWPLVRASAQTFEPPRRIPQFLRAQFTLIAQYLPPLHALYRR